MEQKEIKLDIAKTAREDKQKAQLKMAAVIFKYMVDAYIGAGFTREEAIIICCNMVKQ